LQAQLRWEKDGWLGDDSGQLAVALLDDTLAGIVAWRTIATGGLMAAAWRSAPCSFPSTAAKASGRPRNGCSPSTCSPAPWRTASRPSPTSRTWPSGGHWSASGSAARASCVASPSTVAAGTTARSTPAFETTPPDRRSTSPSTLATHRPARRERVAVPGEARPPGEGGWRVGGRVTDTITVSVTRVPTLATVTPIPTISP
jgi:hypothetical protein